MYSSDFASKKYVVEAKYCVKVIFSRLNEGERSRIDKKHVPFHLNEAETSRIGKKQVPFHLLANYTDTVSQS